MMCQKRGRLVNGKGPIGTGIGSMMVMGKMDPASDEARALGRWRKDFEYEAAIDEEGAGGNLISPPSPCGGSMAAFASGFSADTHVANYINGNVDPTIATL